MAIRISGYAIIYYSTTHNVLNHMFTNYLLSTKQSTDIHDINLIFE